MDICLKKWGDKDIIGGIMDIHFAWYAIDWIHYNTHTFEWSSGYIGITVRQCLSIRGFVFGLQLFLSFDILVILCLACECITMVRCVACIHDLCMTLTFHLNMKVIFSPWIWVWQDFLCFLIEAYQILAYGCITMRQNVLYILDLWPICGWRGYP